MLVCGASDGAVSVVSLIGEYKTKIIVAQNLDVFAKLNTVH